MKRVYGHLGNVRHQSEVVEYTPSVLNEIADRAEHKLFRDRLAAVTKLKIA